MIYESVSGNMKNQAVLSILFEVEAGAKNAEMDNWDFLSIPSSDIRKKPIFFR